MFHVKLLLLPIIGVIGIIFNWFPILAIQRKLIIVKIQNKFHVYYEDNH